MIRFADTTPFSIRPRRIMPGVLAILLFDFLVIEFNIPFLRQFFGLISLLAIPGLLIIILFKIVCSNFWEYLVMSIGLSIAFLIFTGLILNQAFLLLGIQKPLSDIYIYLLVFICCLVMVSLILLLRKEDEQIKLFIAPARSRWYLILIPVTFPILSAVGAIFLNNGQSNLIAVTALILISVFVLLVCWNPNQIMEDLVPFSILMIGLAMLLSFSLRSWHISGWDINLEYYVYQLTKLHQEWQIGFFQNPYNACLSLTILPNMLNSFLGINDEYIFKIVYQLIFAFVPLIIFLTGRKYVSSILAFLACMFYIFQPWFIQPAPALARQEIGLLFFALLIWVTFHPHFSKNLKMSLQVLFGAGIITSHYSTAYISLILFTLTFVGSFFLRKVYQLKTSTQLATSISGWVLLILFGFTFYWSDIQTHTIGNVSYIFQITIQNMKNILISDLRSEDIQLIFLNESETFDLKDVRNYVQQQTTDYSSRPNLYSSDAIKDYSTKIVTSPQVEGIIKFTPLQEALSTGFFGTKQLTKVFLVIGAILWMIFLFRSRYFGYEYRILNLVSVCILLLWILLPILSLYYNLYRIYLQLLIVSSVSLIFGFVLIFSRFLKRQTITKLISILLIFFFISTNGLLSYIIGGPAKMNLNNFGNEYDKFYTHSQEVNSAMWLALNRSPDTSIYADETAALRLFSFGIGINDIETAILPSTIAKDSFVYLNYANIWSRITEAEYAGKQISYEYPIDFLDKNKNLIYDNGGSKIYK